MISVFNEIMTISNKPYLGTKSLGGCLIKVLFITRENQITMFSVA